MGELIVLQDVSSKYRENLSDLENRVSRAAISFKTSLSPTQHNKFRAEFRKHDLNLDINKITRNSQIVRLFNCWCLWVYKYNLVHGTEHQENLGNDCLQLVA